MKSVAIARDVVDIVFPSKLDKALWLGNGVTWTAVLFLGGLLPISLVMSGTLIYTGTTELLRLTKEERAKLSDMS